MEKSNLQPTGGATTQWARIVMEKSTYNLIKNLNHKNFNVLEISGDKWKNFDFKSYHSVNFPDFDITKDILNERFDLIIAEQVFEHLTCPYQSAKNIYSMLVDGGHLLITTPFLIRYHPEPSDCTRWTEVGMKYFLAECGFSVDNIKTESWGNKTCVIENLDEWVNYNENLHSLENDPKFPMVVWVLAKK